MSTNLAIDQQGLQPGVALATPLPEARPVIQLDHIHKTYTMGDVEVHALRGVSLTIREGEFVAIMGASGSGKSTTMNILGCLDRPTRGTYILDGEDVSQMSKDEVSVSWYPVMPVEKTASPTFAVRRSGSCFRVSICFHAPLRWRTLSCRCYISALIQPSVINVRWKRSRQWG